MFNLKKDKSCTKTQWEQNEVHSYDFENSSQAWKLYINYKANLIFNKNKMNKKAEIERTFKDFMLALWLDLNDDNFVGTPDRVARMYINETCSSLFNDIWDLKITDFDNKNNYNWMVVVKDIEVHSMCAHHFQNFDWYCQIAYIPGKKIIWLSKFSRIVDFFSRKPQTQEFLIQEIFEFLKNKLQTENIAISIDCIHNCMKVRWVEEPCSSTATALMWGLFLHSEATRNEFWYHCKKRD